MVRVIQISDTHLSPVKRHFYPNWAPLKAWVAQQKPDLVVHSGDITVDAADQEDDAAHCAALLKQLRVPVLAVPGNHDVGEPASRHQPPNAQRLDRFRRHFGADRWVHDVEGWRLIGFNTMLLASGLSDESDQAAWLKDAMANARGRKLVWITHKPLFMHDPLEGESGYWTVKPSSRARLLDLMKAHSVEIVATGHLHRWLDRTIGGTRHIWTPSTGFLVGNDQDPPTIGAAKLGALVYDIDGHQMTATIVPVPGLTEFWIDDVVDEVYPSR